MNIHLVVFLFSINVLLISCAKILALYPTPCISHQLVFRKLTLELVRRGHEITVITTDPAFPKNGAPSNLTEIDIHKFSYEMWREALDNKTSGSKDNIVTQSTTIITIMGKIFEKHLTIADVHDIIYKRKGTFDILLLEAYLKPALILSHIYKVPVIHVSSFDGVQYNFEAVGAPMHPFLYPWVVHQKIYNLSNFDKIQQLYNRWRIENAFDVVEQEDNKMLQRLFGPDTPSIWELSNNIHMLFLNVHPVWTSNRPVPPNVIYIGGIHKNPRKILPNDLNLLLNQSTNGAIYFSLGTNVQPSLLASNKIQMMVKVFSQLPYDVIWKWDQDTLPGITENIKIYKWLPQPDLLKHPKIKLFITQGGLQSTDEAIDAGVPLIGIPMFMDQWYNTEKYEYHKIGIKLDFPTLTEDVFNGTINKVISDKSYKENIIKLRSIMDDSPQTPLERAVWWTEYVIRHGGAKHLRAAGANVSWSQYLELELVAIVVLSLLSASLIFCTLLYIVTRFVSQFMRRNIKRKIT